VGVVLVFEMIEAELAEVEEILEVVD